MSKKEQPPILSNEELIKEYLKQSDDFALELNIFDRLQKLKFKCSHSGTYEDPVTNLSRQYDIRAEEVRPQNGDVRIKMAVECKAIKNLLLVHHVERPREERLVDVILPPGDGRNNWSVKKGIFYKSNTVGKSFTQLMQNVQTGKVTGKDEEIYVKWAQSISSCKDLTDDEISYEGPSRAGNILSHVKLPVLVIPDGMLWSVSFSIGNEEVKEINHCEYYIGKNFNHLHFKNQKLALRAEVSHIHIVTQSYLEEFVEGVRSRLENQDYKS